MDPYAADRIEQRLLNLERRLARLEGAGVGAEPPAAAAIPPAAPPVTAPSKSAEAWKAGTLARAQAAAAESKEDRSGAWSFERLLGGRAFAALGAIGIVIGMGFFVKLAYDEGWIRLSPAMRCAGAGAFGAALLAIGVWSRRRLAAWAVAGLMSAGLGVMYGAGYAAFSMYDLLSPGAALALLAAVCALGAVLGARTKLSPVALLSVVAAYAAPVAVAERADSPWAMPPYLLAVFAASLFLSRRPGRGFDAARTLSWWGVALLGALWTLDLGDTHPWFALAFLAATAALVHADLALRARRADGRTPPAEDGWLDHSRGRIGLASFAALGWAALLGVFTLIESNAAPEWMWPAGLGVAAFAGGLILAGHLRFGREPICTDAEALGAALLVGAGCAGGYALTLALSGWTEVYAWLGVGVGAALAGAWVRSRPLQVYALATMALGSAGAVAMATMTPGVGTPRMGIDWSRGTWVLLGAALAWALTARLLIVGAGPAWTVIANLALAIGALLAAGAFALGEPEPESLAMVWIVLSAAFAWPALFERRLALREAALGLAGVSIIAWAAAYANPEWMTEGGAILGLRPGLWAAMLIALATGAIGVWLRVTEKDPAHIRRMMGSVAIGAAAILVLVATSMEAARLAAVWTTGATARAAAVSLWWGVFGLGALIVGVRLRNSPTRFAALGLILLAAAKAAIVDLAQAAPAWRVASFVGLGLLMLGVAVGYSRLARKSAKQQSSKAQME